MGRKLTIALGILALTACSSGGGKGGGGGSGSGSGSGTSGNTGGDFTGAKGVVKDITGSPIEGVFVNLVQGDGDYVDTDAQGAFSLPFAAMDDVTLAVSKSGYVSVQRVIDIKSSGTTFIEVTLAPESEPQPLDAAAGGTVEVGGASMTAQANVFATKAGEAFVGTVAVTLTHLDAADPAQLAAAPAALDDARNAANEPVALESFGMINVDIEDQLTGDNLDIADGQTVMLRFPVPSNVTNPPETIPLWNAEWTTWREEGMAVLNKDLNVYEGEVSHFSTWNCDKPLTATCIKGVALDDSGKPVPGAFVVASGIDYNGSSSAVAGDDGVFCVAVRQNSKVNVKVYGVDGVAVPREVDSGSEGTEVPPQCDDERCLDAGSWTVKGGGGGGGTGTGTGTGTGGGGDPTIACNILKGLDPCIDGLAKIFTCYYDNGECDLEDGKLKFTGSNGQLCGTATFDLTGNNSDVTYQNASNQTWVLKDATGDSADVTVICPGNKEVIITEDQKEAVKACYELESDNGGACFDNSDLGGNPCTSKADCKNDQVCCEYSPELKFCTIQQACPQQ